MAKQFTLHKTERLKSRKLIEQLFKQGKSFAEFPFRIFYITGNAMAGISAVQFGVGASTRNFKRAVDRNRIKRLTREAWRLQKNELQQYLETQGQQLSVFFIYTGKEIPAYADVYEKLGLILSKLITLLGKKNPSAS